MSEARLWTYDDVMAYTGYSRRLIQLAISSKRLLWTGSPSAKRFRKADVDAWLESMKGEQPTNAAPSVRRKPKPYVPVHIKR